MERQSGRKGKRRGPLPTGKGTLIGVRLQPGDLSALDRWIQQQGEHQTRPEAIRKLVNTGLEISGIARALTINKSPFAVELAGLKIHQLLKPDEFPELKVEKLMADRGK
ncbi:MAG TPA: hypothetical protein VHQ48_02560 [Bradyrhizobium sp.]|jgi:hypothetical protein|nr:hypothetical protein [Bradyrhizobium sp.]